MRDVRWLRWLRHRCGAAKVRFEVVWIDADVEATRANLQQRASKADIVRASGARLVVGVGKVQQRRERVESERESL